jgi:matrixin
MSAKIAPAGLALLGTVLTVAGLLGVGTATAGASTSASHYRLTYATDSYTGLTEVVRWAPCVRLNGVTRVHVIHYRVHTAGVAHRVRLARRAIRRVAYRTGLHFHYDGRTSYVPQGTAVDGGMRLNAADQRRATHGAQLVIAWAYKGTGRGHSNLLTDQEAGVGSISWASQPLVSQLRIDDAAVVIKRGVRMKSGFRAGGSIGTLLLHELGHAMGLQHVRDTSQVMYPVIGANSPAGYAAGDRTGLAKVGFSWNRCLTTPALTPVNP